MSLSSSHSVGAELRARARINSDDTDLPRDHVTPNFPAKLRRRSSQHQLFVLKLLGSLFAIVSLIFLFHIDTPTTFGRRLYRLSNSSNPISRNPIELALTTTVPNIPKSFPTVERSILERLEGPRTSSKEKFAVERTWPPIVTRTPESIQAQAPSLSSLCSQSPCRILLPNKIAEQESKGRLHLAQLFKFAEKLNRTLVLPKVGKSRLGACSRQKFELYYDLEEILARNSAVVTMDAFEKWLGDKREVFMQALYLDHRPNNLLLDATLYPDFKISTDSTRNTIPKCLAEKFHLSIATPSSAIVIHPKHRKHQLLGDNIIAALHQDAPVALESDVLVVNWNLRFPLFQPPLPGIGYSLDLLHLSEQLAPPSPYLMVHWRMESISPEVFTNCALALVDFLSSTLRDPILGAYIKTVWFASDHPISLSVLDCPNAETTLDESSFPRKSNTFINLAETHVDALRIVRESFCSGGELEGWTVTDLTETLAGAGDISGYDSDMLADPGLLGILDKLVGVRATIFASGSRTCAKKSSFTKQIVDMRKEESRQRNVVDYFG